jgi:hypothetical protein
VINACRTLFDNGSRARCRWARFSRWGQAKDNMYQAQWRHDRKHNSVQELEILDNHGTKVPDSADFSFATPLLPVYLASDWPLLCWEM